MRFVVLLILDGVIMVGHPIFEWWTQIYKGHPRPCIPPSVMASSAMGAQIGGLRVFADHTRKTNAPTIFACCAAFHMFIFTLGPC